MNKIKKFTLVCILTLSSFFMAAIPINAANKTTTIWVPLHNQGNKNWCWAVSARMVGHYLYKEYSNEDIVKKIKGSVVNKGSSFSELVSATNYASGYGNNYTGISGNGIGYWRYATSIDNQKPYILHIRRSTDNAGHAIVGRGYDWVENGNSKDLYNLYINDPNGYIRYVSYSGLINGNASNYTNWTIHGSVMAKGKY